MPYCSYSDGRVSYRSQGSIDRFRQPQRTWSEQQLFFDETICKLSQALIEAQKFFDKLQGAFSEETAGIRWYASQQILDLLWETRLDTKKSSGPNPKLDDQVKQARVKLEKALQAAAYGTKATVSPKKRNRKQAQDKAGIERTISKLQTSGCQCLELLTQSKKKYSQFEPLQKELEFLKTIVDGWNDLDGDVDGQDSADR